MQPLGRHPINFPSKTKEFFGKGIRMWWEAGHEENKAAEKRQAKKEIAKELNSPEPA
jgi:hypothetical protein